MRFLQRLIAAASFGFIALGAGASPANPQNGTDYTALQQAVPTESGNKVEVIEFFSYHCPHCFAFDPALTQWVKKQGDRIAFKRVHIQFGGPESAMGRATGALQKLYYTLETMGKLDEMHEKVFNAVHRDHTLNLQDLNDQTLANFVAKYGIDKKQFLDMYNSFGVQAKARHATQLMQAYNVDSVPTLAVGGRYITSPAMVGNSAGTHTEAESGQAVLPVLDYLVAKAAKDHPAAAASAKAAAKPEKPAHSTKK